VTNAGSNSVSVIDTSTNAVSATLPVGLRPVNCRRLLIHSD
jgi:YVTN family beta-propeller protein